MSSLSLSQYWDCRYVSPSLTADKKFLDEQKWMLAAVSQILVYASEEHTENILKFQVQVPNRYISFF